MTTSVSPARQAASASRRPGAIAMGAGQTVVDVDAFGGRAERREGATLGGEVLGVGGDPRVADQQLGHLANLCPVSRTVTGHFTGRVLWDDGEVAGSQGALEVGVRAALDRHANTCSHRVGVARARRR